MTKFASRRGVTGTAGLGCLLLAQQAQAAVVIVAPLSQPAPALGTWMLLLLAVLLTGLAVRKLRGPSPAITAAVAVLATMTAFAAITSAGGTVTILVDGSDCIRRTEYEYNSNNRTNVESDCSAPIQIVLADPECDAPTDTPLGSVGVSPQPCEPGTILESGERCRLPDCDD